MPLYQDEGVVLRTAKLGEADRILTLLTRDHGKVRAVAKGVRRTKSRFGGRLEPFMRVALLIAEGRSLDVVSQAESIAAYAGPICADFQAYTAANVICETADNLVATEKEPAPCMKTTPGRPFPAPFGLRISTLMFCISPVEGRFALMVTYRFATS